MKSLQTWTSISGVFCLSLLLRIVYNQTVARGYMPHYDAGTYQSIALNLLKEHCFCQVSFIPTVGRAPLWPTIIAFIYHLVGMNNLYARCFLCVVGAGTCVLVYLFAQKLFNEGTAIIAGILAALYPGLYIYDGWLYSESLYTFLLLAFSYTLYQLQRTSHTRWSIVSGMLLALLALTRPNGPIVLLLFIVWAIFLGWIHLVSWRVSLTSIAVVTCITLVLIAPWTMRNYVVAHSFILIASGDGTVLDGAYNDLVLPKSDIQGQWAAPSRATPDLRRRYDNCSKPSYAACDVQRENAYKDHAMQWVRTHMTVLPHLLELHFVKMWTPLTPEADLPMNQFPERQTSQLVLTQLTYSSFLVFILAALGLLLTKKKWRDLLFPYLVIALTIVQCLYFYGSSRFRAPIEPMLILFVAGVIWWVGRKTHALFTLYIQQHHFHLAK